MVRVTPTRDQRGVVLVFVSITLVMVLTMTALVIDMGAARNERRDSQNAADASALAAAGELPDAFDADAMAVDLATNANLEGGNNDWAACFDADQLAVDAGGSPCVSFDTSFTRARVHTPSQSVGTQFAGIIGVHQINTSASAEALVRRLKNGGIFPFSVTGPLAGEGCLLDPPGGIAPDPCVGPSHGRFGFLDLKVYGNEELPTPVCANGENNRLNYNLAFGTDHDYTVYAAGDSVIPDACGTPGPNAVFFRSGAVTSVLDGPFLYDDDVLGTGTPAQLRQIPSGFASETIENVALDDQPLWSFISTSATSDVPPSCYRSTFDSYYGDLTDETAGQAATIALLASAFAPAPPPTAPLPQEAQERAMNKALANCFEDYRAGVGCSGGCDGVLFDSTNILGEVAPDGTPIYDIVFSTRFGWVPILATDNNPSSTPNPILGWQPVFLHRVFIDCNGTTCTIDFSPQGSQIAEVPNNAPGNRAAPRGISVWVFDPNMLPPPLGTDPFAPNLTRIIELVD